MDSQDGSLFKFSREWACEPARVHVFLGHFAQLRMKKSVPTEHRVCADKSCKHMY